jgi:hypothetical protein
MQSLSGWVKWQRNANYVQQADADASLPRVAC